MPAPPDDERLRRAAKPAEDAMRLHRLYRGKMQTLPKCPVRGGEDFSIWYSPGVAAPCQAIRANPDEVYELTNKANTIAVVSDGTRVLGLGDIGPHAGLPVMEGKALLFKYLGGVDAVALCLATTDPDELVRTVEILAPSFGGINLEDIAQPKCFRVLERLRARLAIPVWHDDQQGSATVLLAGLLNACELVGKELASCRIVLVGFGAANASVYRLLRIAGADPQRIVACDSRGTLHRGRGDLDADRQRFPEKWQACTESNGDRIDGGVAEALVGADVCIAFSRPGPEVIRGEWIATMAPDAIVFACANPVPEIWPWDALAAGARIVATGRGDFPNQVNNSLGFPGVFRGVLDVRARTITDEMALAAAHEIARFARARGIHDQDIVPHMDEWELVPGVAAAVGTTAIRQGVAGIAHEHDDLHRRARATIAAARHSVDALMASGSMAPTEP
jgi:malate dehydrogenase (oxaloacetate-decarboxylating)